MFESVNALSRRLPRPALTGDPRQDRQAREDIIARARLLQSEAVACIARAMLAWLGQGWHKLTRPLAGEVRHQT